MIFEEENFSGNLQDLIENLHTLNMLASNITRIEEPGLKKVNVTNNTDKGRSLKEDFVFNDVALESVENLADYKDELDPIYGLDDPNDIIGIDDVIASVTIRVDDDDEGRSKDQGTKVDTTKDMNATAAEANGGNALPRKENETEKKGKWVWRRRRESGKTERLVENQREIQRREDFLGKTRERVRRQVLDAVLVPCKTGQLCIISGQSFDV